MPANLPPDYFKAEDEYRKAKTIDQKMDALEKMYAIIPKHKGTEKLRADIKRRMAKLRDEERTGRRRSKKGYGFYIEKEGAGQVVLAGPPNSGKSLLMKVLTRTSPEVAEYPFTTRRPLTGMMSFENVQIQLIDSPPLSREFMESWVPQLIRYCHVVGFVFDASSNDLLERFEECKSILNEYRIGLKGEEGLFGFIPDSKSFILKRYIMIGNKCDLPGADENLNIFNEIYGGFPLYRISALTGMNIETLKRGFFDSLEIIRVYTKSPGKEPDFTTPIILKKGSTLYNSAEEIHKDFAEKLKFARIWGPGRFNGQKVNKDMILQDGDVVEFHI